MCHFNGQPCKKKCFYFWNWRSALNKGNTLGCINNIYPPQVKVYELRQLALKFERHLDSGIIDFEVLALDFRLYKIVLCFITEKLSIPLVNIFTDFSVTTTSLSLIFL